VIDEELVPDPVQLIGGDPGRDMPADLFERAGGEPPGHPHPLDGLRVLDVRLAGTRVLTAHVLGPRNGGRHLSLGRNPAGVEQGRHGLGF
jgi:hypothetical protein